MTLLTPLDMLLLSTSLTRNPGVGLALVPHRKSQQRAPQRGAPWLVAVTVGSKQLGRMGGQSSSVGLEPTSTGETRRKIGRKPVSALKRVASHPRPQVPVTTEPQPSPAAPLWSRLQPPSCSPHTAARHIPSRWLRAHPAQVPCGTQEMVPGNAGCLRPSSFLHSAHHPPFCSLTP